MNAEFKRASTERSDGMAESAPPAYSSCVAAKRDADSTGTDKDLRLECKAQYETLRAQALNNLVQLQWLIRESQRRHIDGDREFQRALDRANKFRARAGDLSPLTHSNLTLRTEALGLKLSAVIPLREQEIQAYGVANGNVYYDSEARVTQILQTNSKDKALRGRQEVEEGTGWATVQRRYGRGKYLPWTGKQTVKKNTAPVDAFGRIIFSARPHKLLGPVHTLNGWFVIEVLKVIPPRHRGLTRQNHRYVEAIVRSKKLGTALRSRYAKSTACAPKYKVADAPACE